MIFLSCCVGEDSRSLGLQRDQTSPSKRKSVLNIHWKDWCWSWSSNTLATDVKSQLIGKDPDAGKNWRQEEKGMTEDEMIRWNHWLNGHEFEEASGDGEGQGSLVCCSPWGCKELDTTKRLNNKNCHFEQLQKEWQTKSKVRRRKKIIQVNVEDNEKIKNRENFLKPKVYSQRSIKLTNFQPDQTIKKK